MTVTAGPNQATSCVTTGGFGLAWSNPSNALTDNGSYATVALKPSPQQTSEYLEWYDFGFSLTSNAVISGIRVVIEKSVGQAGFNVGDFLTVKLEKARTPVGSAIQDSNWWPSSDGSITYGGAASLWGTTWSISDVATTGFGVVIAARNYSPDLTITALIDNCHVTVYYDIVTSAIKTIDGVARASVKTVNGLALSSLKTYNGLA